ncbi:hypothetical protein CEXT_105001 [Caerostris extrusa]|uniref:Uncharacterized protein n=1 Tax=Caerostris extrusa TaxID=172846 RepID=A0AAV4TDF7_CAEEX|nr:hypothetical protein CEXT_105001 [Caerostris extrusa]
MYTHGHDTPFQALFSQGGGSTAAREWNKVGIPFCKNIFASHHLPHEKHSAQKRETGFIDSSLTCLNFVAEKPEAHISGNATPSPIF